MIWYRRRSVSRRQLVRYCIPYHHADCSMCAHTLTKTYISGGNGSLYLLTQRSPVLPQYPPRARSLLDQPGPHWSRRPSAARPLGDACRWKLQCPLWLRRCWGQYNTPQHATSPIPSPDWSWQRPGHGGRLPPKRCALPHVRIPQRHRDTGLVPPLLRRNIWLTLAQKSPLWPSYPGRLQGWSSPKTSHSRQTPTPLYSRLVYYRFRIELDTQTPVRPPNPSP